MWVASAATSFLQPLFDLGRARFGDAIIAVVGFLHLPPQAIFELAHVLIVLRLLLGTYLLVAVLFAAYERLRGRRGGDDMLDTGLFLSAIASIIASGPLLIQGEGVVEFIGELMLCVIASGLTGLARVPEPATVTAMPTAPISDEPAEAPRLAA
jgi:hypothetical protein